MCAIKKETHINSESKVSMFKLLNTRCSLMLINVLLSLMLIVITANEIRSTYSSCQLTNEENVDIFEFRFSIFD